MHHYIQQKLLLLILLPALLVIACKSSLEVEKKEYKGETFHVVNNKIKVDSSERVVFIPEVDKSDLVVSALFKSLNKPATYITFLADSNKVRQQQVDNLNNRIDFYSEQLLQISSRSKELIVVAEGINANILAHLAHAYPIKKLILINPYKPDLEQVMIRSCFQTPGSANCDSLLKTLRLNNLQEMEVLINTINNPTADQQIGRYTLDMWRSVLRYSCNPRENKYAGELEYLFTNQSGVASENDSTNTISVDQFLKELKKRLNN